MKQLRVISVLMIVFILATFIPINAQTQEELGNVVSNDVSDMENSAIISKLTAFNIMSGDKDGSFRWNDTMTRAEFATVITNVLGISDVADTSEQETVFTDVYSDHWAFGKIMTAFQLGYMSGYGDGRFGTEDPIQFEQAVKVMISILGFDFYAKDRGGYPTGYLIVASEKGLLKSIKSESVITADRGIIATMLNNALDIDMMTRETYGDKVEYTVSKDKTLLSEKLKVYKIKGQIKAVGKKGIRSENQVSNDSIQINNESFKTGKMDAWNLLGYYVEGYYQVDDISGFRTLIWLEKQQGKNEEKVIKAIDIVSYSDHVFKYKENQKNEIVVEEIKVPSDIAFIYNGKTVPKYEESMLTPEVGDVIFMDADGNGKYDLIFVKDYNCIVVQSASPIEKTIYAKDYPEKNFTVEDDMDFKIKDKNGKQYELEDLMQWDVLCVLETSDHKEAQALLINDKVEGTITEVWEDDGNLKVKINDNEYVVDSNSSDDIEPDMSGMFYQDVDGRIVAVQNIKAAEEWNNGYLINVSAASKSTIDKSIKIKLMDASGKVRVMNTAVKYTIDGAAVARSSDAVNQFVDSKNVVLPQVIRYQTNKLGEIKAVLKYKVATGSEDPQPDELYRIVEMGTSKRKYRSFPNSFNGEIIGSGKTIIMRVPANEGKNVPEDNAYSVRSLSNIGDHSENYVEAYAIGHVQGFADIILMTYSNSISDSSPFVLFDKVTKAVDKQGKTVWRMYGMRAGKYQSVDVVEDRWEYTIKQGDIVKYNLDYNNQASIKPTIFFNKERAAEFSYNGDVLAGPRYVYGEVYWKDENLIRLYIPKATKYEYMNLVGNVSVMSYDSSAPEGKRVQIAKLSDLIAKSNDPVKFSKVLILTHNGEVKEIYIYK